MKFRVPLTFSDVEILKRRSKAFMKFAGPKKRKIDDYLKASDVDLEGRQYLAICFRQFFLSMLSFSVIFTSILGLINVKLFYVFGLGIAFLLSGFILFNQINYPKVFSMGKQRGIERNLIPVLQDMMVQLNSGVPIFRIMVNIADSDYGEVSQEFKKIVKEINSGISQIDAIEIHAKLNTSKYFRRVLWQISNGMRSGSDMSIVIEEGINALNEEQTIQIQGYGSKLNPLIMFYMLIAIVLPSLGITFLIIISSLVGIEGNILQIIFITIFFFVVFMQIMFLGMIKSKRPSLL